MENVLKKIQDKILHSIIRDTESVNEADSKMITNGISEREYGEGEQIEDERDDDSDYVELEKENMSLSTGDFDSDDAYYHGLSNTVENEEEESGVKITTRTTTMSEFRDEDEDEDEDDSRLFMNVMSSQIKPIHKYRDSLGPRKVKRAEYEEFYLGDMKLSRMILDYSKSVRRQDYCLNRIEKIYNKKHVIKSSIGLLKMMDEVEDRMMNVVNDKKWKREVIMKSINKELNKMIKENELSNFRDVSVIGQKYIKENSKKMANLQRKHQKLIIDHEILQGECEELKRSYLDLKNKYELLLEERPESNGSLSSISSFGKAANFANSQKVLKGLNIDRGRHSKGEIGGQIISEDM